MSKYGWISPAAEQYLDLAVKERVLRWAVLTPEWFPGRVKSELEQQLLQFILRWPSGYGPGANDMKLEGLKRRLKQEQEEQRYTRLQQYTRAQLVQSQAHKYRGTTLLRSAIYFFKHQKVEDLDGAQPRSMKRHLRMKKKAGDLKRFMKEVQRRYEVVDRVYNARVVRANGKVVRLYP